MQQDLSGINYEEGSKTHPLWKKVGQGRLNHIRIPRRPLVYYDVNMEQLFKVGGEPRTRAESEAEQEECEVGANEAVLAEPPSADWLSSDEISDC